jgi:hypothetical protein
MKSQLSATGQLRDGLYLPPADVGHCKRRDLG